MAIKGGARQGAGRKKGSPNKANQLRQAAVEASGITPLDFLLNVMRAEYPEHEGEPLDFKTVLARETLKFEAAKAAAPYVHPRLATVEHQGNKDRPIEHKIAVEFVRAAQKSGE